VTTRARLVVASAAFLVATCLVVLPAVAQRGGQHGGRPHESNPPRANQGHIPPAPPRSNPGEVREREAEHLPTGHVNDTPHVNHDRWFGHDVPNDERFRLERPFDHGRFAHLGPAVRHRVVRIDANLHRFWLSGGGFFDVAAWDWPLCADWCWSCGDDFVVYDDPDHAGWYLLYNIHTGVYVHCQYLGI
jgi:hypothetical protein